MQGVSGETPLPGVNSRAWCPVFASGGRCQVSAVLSTEDGVVGRRMLCSPIVWSTPYQATKLQCRCPLFAPWCSLASVWVDGQLVNGQEANGPVRRWAFSAAQSTCREYRVQPQLLESTVCARL